MLIIVIFQTVVIIILFSLFLRQRRSLSTQTNSNLKSEIQLSHQQSYYFGYENRQTFRIPMNKEECLIEFTNVELDHFNHKQFIGYIENISIDGMKIISKFDFPSRQTLMVNAKFCLIDQKFNLKGQIIKKEEHIHKSSNIVAYVVKFQDMSEEQHKMFILVLNQILVERNNKVS